MNDKRIYRVGMLGLSETEERMLVSLGRLSSSRPRSYEFVELDDLNPDFHTRSDIVFVNADNAHALKSWGGGVHEVPAIFVTSTEMQGHKYLKRPFMGARVLAILDEVAEKISSLGGSHGEGQNASSGATEAAQKQGRLLALVVDDSPTVRKHIRLDLSHFPVDIHFAETGEEALDRLAGYTYDIVFLDVELPGVDGYSVCKTIKKDKGMKSTPVIMLTGKTSTFDKVKGALAGCDTYLTKPVDYDVFQNVVKKYLGDKLGEYAGF